MKSLHFRSSQSFADCPNHSVVFPLPRSIKGNLKDPNDYRETKHKLVELQVLK